MNRPEKVDFLKRLAAGKARLKELIPKIFKIRIRQSLPPVHTIDDKEVGPDEFFEKAGNDAPLNVRIRD